MGRQDRGPRVPKADATDRDVARRMPAGGVTRHGSWARGRALYPQQVLQPHHTQPAAQLPPRRWVVARGIVRAIGVIVQRARAVVEVPLLGHVQLSQQVLDHHGAHRLGVERVGIIPFRQELVATRPSAAIWVEAVQHVRLPAVEATAPQPQCSAALLVAPELPAAAFPSSTS